MLPLYFESSHSSFLFRTCCAFAATGRKHERLSPVINLNRNESRFGFWTINIWQLLQNSFARCFFACAIFFSGEYSHDKGNSVNFKSERLPEKWSKGTAVTSQRKMTSFISVCAAFAWATFHNQNWIWNLKHLSYYSDAEWQIEGCRMLLRGKRRGKCCNFNANFLVAFKRCLPIIQSGKVIVEWLISLFILTGVQLGVC